MGKTTGFLEYDRKDGQNILPKDRITNFNEFHTRLSDKEQQSRFSWLQAKFHRTQQDKTSSYRSQ